MMDALQFARDWEAGWNSHDLDRILSHYHPNISFRSRKAHALTDTGIIKGHTALRSYRAAELESQPQLEFRVQDVFEGFEMMVISYLNHRDVLATETLNFGEDGHVIRAAVCHRFAAR